LLPQEKSKRLLVSPKRDIKKLEEIEETETPVAVDIWPVSRSKGVGVIVATGFVVDYDADTRTLRFVADTMDPIGSKIHLDKVFRIMLCPNEVILFAWGICAGDWGWGSPCDCNSE
jgi:hypothetical protein